MNNRQYAEIASNGDTEWVSLRGGGMVSVDCVDPTTGESMAWGGASAALLYSPDKKQRCAVSDDSGDVIGTDGFCRKMDSIDGFVAIGVSSYSTGKFQICVVSQ